MSKSAEVILHRDLSTNTQVGILLGICGSMTGFLTGHERDSENIPGKHPLPGEAKIAAETTFIKACSRIDDIIENSLRWGIGYQLILEKQYNERHEASMRLLQLQQEAEEQRKKSAAALTSPNFRYKPVLIPMEDGRWMAFLGNMEDLDSGILGLGDNPAAALRSFDETFSGNLSPEVTEWLKQHEENLQNGVATTLPFPKHTRDEKNLDSQRNDQTPQSSESGNDNAANSGGPGENPILG